MIINELNEIKKIIQDKKTKFQKSHINYKELNNILGKNNNNKPNLLLELTAHEILSDLKFLEIIQQVFVVDLDDLVKMINNDFESSEILFEVRSLCIEDFDEIKTLFSDYMVAIKEYYGKKHENINKLINKQDADIDDIMSEFRLIEKITKEKLEKTENGFKKFEKKYLDILIYIKEKISN